MLRTIFRQAPRANFIGTRAIHEKGSQVPKTEANTGTHGKPKQTNITGDKGDGDMPHPQEYVDGIEPVSGEEASPEKKPTRSTGIKSGASNDTKNHFWHD